MAKSMEYRVVIIDDDVQDSILIKDEIVKRDLKARKENSPVDCF